MTTDKEIFDAIAAEGYEEGFSGDREYSEPKFAPREQVSYKVWNNSPANPSPTATPGIVMKVKKPIPGAKKGEPRYGPAETEVVAKVRAVILYTSDGRELGRGQGAQYQTVCSSHDGEVPSVRISKPLCRSVTADDLAQTFSQWKGFDKAKVDAKVADVTQGSGKLSVCGLKTKDGFITLCPYGRKDPVTGVKASCKQHIFVHAYDIDRKREFVMKLTGSSIQTGKFIAPYHEFFKFLRSAGPVGEDGKAKGLPCYAFRVDLAPLQDKAFYLLNVTNWKPIESAENRAEMKDRALAAREAYDRQAAFLSKEQYEANKQAARPPESKLITPTSLAVVKEDEAVPSGAAPTPQNTSQPIPQVAQALPQSSLPVSFDRSQPHVRVGDTFSNVNPTLPVSFEDDDINF